MRHFVRSGLPAVVGVIAFAATGTATTGTAYLMTAAPKTAPQRTLANAPVTSVVPVVEPRSALRRVVPPDLLIIAAKPVSRRQLDGVAKLGHVRDVITADGGVVRLQGGAVNMFGVDPVAFRSWTPPGTASDDRLWSALAQDQFVVSGDVRQRLRLRDAQRYPIAGKTELLATMGGSGALGLPGINVLVGRDTGRKIGLVSDIALLVNAPGADPRALEAGLRKVVGAQSQIIDLNEKQYQPTPQQGAPSGRAATYLDLYKQAAATCPGLSWAVLAAIGQIESDHGRNMGPSSAGALGPMQFMPATWRVYGVDGDSDGKANIMDPYDAVPAAAKYLCASGAGQGGASVSRAVWAYNHSQAYVNAVLSLAQSYAQHYS